jgi:2-C-methyl-D-erythritol 2,4-cyclodiphosphate synthase
MIRVGSGNDLHRLIPGKPLILGGITIPSDLGADGHSDADCLFHAITDALLGSLALGDIGLHFYDKDPRWTGADSRIFLEEALRLSKEMGWSVVNVDSTISLEKPKLRPFIDEIRQSIARSLGIELNCVSVKAKTGEGVDAVGERRAIRAEAVLLIQKDR